jgi:molybdopterin-binding protein
MGGWGMSIFAVCSNFVANSGKDKRYLINILYRFLQDNPLRIALDRPSGRILGYYTQAVRDSKSTELKRWLRYLGRNFTDNVEYIELDCSTFDEKRTFIEIANAAIPERCLIAWSLQDYKDQDLIRERGIEVVERVHAAERIRQHDRAVNQIRAPEIKSAREGDVVINIIRDIEHSTVITSSLVQNSFNQIKQHDAETAEALLKIADFIDKSNNKGAGELLDSINKELVKPEPSKPVMKSLWDGIIKILPDITKLTEAVSKIAKLFA